MIERCLGDCQKDKILDVGCGTGFISLLLAQIGCDVIAIDNNIAMLKEAEKTSEELGLSNKITFMLMISALGKFFSITALDRAKANMGISRALLYKCKAEFGTMLDDFF